MDVLFALAESVHQGLLLQTVLLKWSAVHHRTLHDADCSEAESVRVNQSVRRGQI